MLFKEELMGVIKRGYSKRLTQWDNPELWQGENLQGRNVLEVLEDIHDLESVCRILLRFVEHGSTVLAIITVACEEHEKNSIFQKP